MFFYVENLEAFTATLTEELHDRGMKPSPNLRKALADPAARQETEHLLDLFLQTTETEPPKSTRTEPKRVKPAPRTTKRPPVTTRK